METALRDLSALMAKARDMVELAQYFRERTAARREGAPGWLCVGVRGVDAWLCLWRLFGGSRPSLCTCPAAGPTPCALPAGAAGEGEELDAETALDLLDLGIVSPVTRETAGSLYHQELSRQVGGQLQDRGAGTNGCRQRWGCWAAAPPTARPAAGRA